MEISHPLTIDHLAVVASSLSEGCEYVKDCLGIDIPFGGEHPHMGTHNCLAKLGDDEFLEIIAINPDAPQPSHARWFNLDNHGNRAPYLAHWIARTDSLADAMEFLPAEVGTPKTCSRGDLSWQLTVPDDGTFAFGGAFPSVIEWPMRPFPGAGMQEVGCKLMSLRLLHPHAPVLQQALQPVLEKTVFNDRIQVMQADRVKLSAEIKTPVGIRTLG